VLLASVRTKGRSLWVVPELILRWLAPFIHCAFLDDKTDGNREKRQTLSQFKPSNGSL
jgi:hypothetical protein